MEYNDAYLQSLYNSSSTASQEHPFAYNLLNSVSSNPFNQWMYNLGGQLDYDRTKASEYRNTMANAYLSATEYKRAVEGMKEAGLNPALAYTNGGSSAVAASSHSFQNSTAGMANIIGAVVQGAFSLARSAIIGENMEDLQLLKNNSAFQLQQDRQAFYRDNPYDYYKNKKSNKSFSQHKMNKKDYDDLYTDFSNLKI